MAFESLQNIDENSITSSPYKFLDGGKIVRALYLGPSPDDVLQSSSFFASTHSTSNGSNGMSAYSTGSIDETTSETDKTRKDFVVATVFLSVLIVLGIAILFFVRYKYKQKEKRERMSRLFQRYDLE